MGRANSKRLVPVVAKFDVHGALFTRQHVTELNGWVDNDKPAVRVCH
jgi:hypothetical protein